MLEFDDILIQIGEFGRVQIVLYFLLGLVGIPCGMQNLMMVFLGAKTNFWCEVPGLQHLSQTLAQNISAPRLEGGSLSSCEIYTRDYSGYGNTSSGSSTLDNGTEVEKCTSWSYDRSEFKSTVRTQWDLVCNQDYIVALMQTVYMCGFLLGTISFGALADRIGRLKTMMIACFLQGVFSIIASLISIYWHFVPFMVVRFLVGMTTAGFFTVTFVLIVEIIGPYWRTYTGIFYQGWFAVGFCILPGVAYALRDMFTVQLASALPTFALLSYYFFIPESPRWQIQQGKFAEAAKTLRKIGKLNKKPLPDDFKIEGKLIKPGEKAEEHTASLLDVLKKPRLRLRFLVSAYCWFVSGIAYYGLSYSAESLGGDIFLNTLISGLVEYPAYLICFFIVGHPKIGRKWSMSLSFFLTGISLIICVGIQANSNLHTALLVIANIGKLGISAAFSIAYIFTAEIFPTVTRSVCVGASSMCARLGALLAPQVMLLWNVWYGLPYLIFGLMALLAGFASIYLPESVQQVLPETIEDGELFGTDAYKVKHHLHLKRGENGEILDDDEVELNLMDGSESYPKVDH